MNIKKLFTDFQAWKSQEEDATMAQFVKARGDKLTHQATLRMYYCNRSGRYVGKDGQLRHLKVQGSCKIGRKCPAAMFVKISTGNCLHATLYCRGVKPFEAKGQIKLFLSPGGPRVKNFGRGERRRRCKAQFLSLIFRSLTSFIHIIRARRLTLLLYCINLMLSHVKCAFFRIQVPGMTIII